jgi:hypothetical protein
MNPELSDFAARLRQLISPGGEGMAGGSQSKPENPVVWAGEPLFVGRDFHSAANEAKVIPVPSEVERFYERHLSPARSPIYSNGGEGAKGCHAGGYSVVGKPAQPGSLGQKTKGHSVEAVPEAVFNQLALELFARQFEANPAYQALCRARGRNPGAIDHWTQIPAVPTAAFKELELSSIPVAERSVVFHSSGTTEQKPSRHFHCAASLAVYEASLTGWFNRNLGAEGPLHFLTPGRQAAPHSSLIYMFDTLRQRRSLPESVFLGTVAGDGSWVLDFAKVLEELQSASAEGRALTLLGTAFSFVHLLDYLAEHQLSFTLPAGSRVMETGGYKNRSRTLPKAELHALITEKLGIPATHIICEYGMSELSSQAYAVMSDEWRVTGETRAGGPPALPFHFPPWARVHIVSPETGREVAEGQTGIIRVFDLANVFSVAAVQTEDLGFRGGTGFDLVGGAVAAEPRGCSLMAGLA